MVQYRTMNSTEVTHIFFTVNDFKNLLCDYVRNQKSYIFLNIFVSYANNDDMENELEDIW